MSLRAEVAEQGASLRAEIAEQGASLHAEIAEQGASLRAEIGVLSAKIDERGIHMRVLHEEVIARIALVQEGMASQPRRPRKR